MPYAISLRLDDAAAARVVGMWRALADAGLDDTLLRLGAAPHITLAVLDDASPLARLQDAFAFLSREAEPLTLACRAFSVFPGARAALVLAPTATEALLRLHARLLQRLDGLTPGAHYRPGCWIPHITLAWAVSDPAACLRVLAGEAMPVQGRLVAAELVRFDPLVEAGRDRRQIMDAAFIADPAMPIEVSASSHGG